jgi:aryl-alcohol dehydrogenase-like predicted oxidoreductase
MERRKLGRTDVEVSAIALGTMTWGEQNTEAEAHSQLDYALERGIDLVDTAEMYPVPPKPETQGRTEAYIGTWLAKSGNRDRIFLATKAAGPPHDRKRPSHLRDGKVRFDRKNLVQALEDSLRRLRTDHVDLYQLHWPDRPVNCFGLTSYPWMEDPDTVPLDETLRVLQDLVASGKIRHIGVSNETPWGVAKFIHLAELHGLPRIVSIQNPYSLLNRTFEIGLSEFAHREQVGLLAYSPLAFGVLSGKYLGGARPAAARLTLFERFTRYSSASVEAATADYVALCRRHGVDPSQVAIQFTLRQKFLTSCIIGATSMDQLALDIDAATVQIPPEVWEGIEKIHAERPNVVQ